MNSYSAYKDSGLPWVGKIPKHWETSKAKWIFKDISQKGFSNEPLLSATQDRGVIPRDMLENRVVMPAGELVNFKLVEIGDFVISLRSFQGGIEFSEFRGLVSPAYTVLREIVPINKNYYKYLLKSFNFIDELDTAITGIRDGKNINFDDFGNLHLLIPPLDEQETIANFLDSKLIDIDRYITKKERLIELLQEQKTVLINHAVTRGLNSYVRMKYSGIEWLGEIPEHWGIKPLFVYFKERSEKNLENKERNILSLSYGQIIRRNMETNLGLFPSSFATYQVVEHGNIILRLTDLQNDHKSLRVGLAKEKGIITAAYLCLESKGSMLPEYIYQYLHTLDTLKIFYGLGGGIRQSLGFDEFKRLPILIPPIKEQEQICKNLNELATPTQATIEKSIKEISLVIQYRTVLIAEAVTGKIDVRN